jgi:hypothetical protein
MRQRVVQRGLCESEPGSQRHHIRIPRVPSTVMVNSEPSGSHLTTGWTGSRWALSFASECLLFERFVYLLSGLVVRPPQPVGPNVTTRGGPIYSFAS